MVQRRLCNHKTGIHEVIVLEFEIRTVCRDKSNIDFVLDQYSIGNKSRVKDVGFASVFYSAFISYIDLVLSQY